jgi:hypothetical protein
MQLAIVTEVRKQFSYLESLASTLSSEAIRCGALRAAILRHAFSGELVKQSPTDEPASLLLEGLATERAPSRRRRQPVVLSKDKGK